MNEQEAQQLLKKYAQGLCTPEEQALVERWYLHESETEKLPDDQADPEFTKNEIWLRLLKTTRQAKAPVKHLIWRKVAVAASVLLILSAAMYIYSGKPFGTETEIVKNSTREIAPGSNKATLTLANGSKIVLDDANGLLAVQSGITVRKSKEGVIIYENNGKIKSGTGNAPQKIETPMGGECQVLLPDGTKVWLNAASDLKFPASFTGNTRIVSLNGEAYFEVAKNKKMPFIVRAKGTEVLVTGTHFNVMAYKDEDQSATTLLEGSVQVSNKSDKVALSPGQQAINTKEQELVKNNVDVETAVAWKNGLFRFDNDDIETVMRQLSRWYNVSVVYKGAIPLNRFGGYISRNSELSQVLKMLELSGLRFSVEGRRINVL